MDLCLAIDIGGTKLAAGLVTAEGDLLEARRTPTPHNADGDELFAALAGLVEDVLGSAAAGGIVSGATVVGCGVGCGGPMDVRRGTVSPLNIPGWRRLSVASATRRGHGPRGDPGQ